MSLLFLIPIYSQPTSDKKLLKLCDDAKVKNEIYFVTMVNGDTLRGKMVTKKQKSSFTTKEEWKIGDKVISPDSVRSYQDEYSYVYIYPYTDDQHVQKHFLGSEFRRVYIGKISLFMSRTNPDRNMEHVTPSTIFYLSRDPLKLTGIVPATTAHLRDMISECKPALEKFDQMFKKANNRVIVDYNKILAILSISDSCN